MMNRGYYSIQRLHDTEVCCTEDGECPEGCEGREAEAADFEPDFEPDAYYGID